MAPRDPVLIEIPMPIRTPRLLIRPKEPGDGATTAVAVAETWDELHKWMRWAEKQDAFTAESMEIRNRHVLSPCNRRLGFKGLEDLSLQPIKGIAIRFVKQTFENIQSRIVANCDSPLSIAFARTIAYTRNGNPKGTLTFPCPETPSVVFLHDLRKLESRILKRSNLAPQPLRKVLAEATWIDEMGLHVPVIEHFSPDGNKQVHSDIIA